MSKLIGDTLIKKHETIKVEILENYNRVDWDFWFLLIAVLSLLSAVLIPVIMRKYEERRTKYGFHLFVKKKFGVTWNILTYDKYPYKQPTGPQELDDFGLTFDQAIKQFVKDYEKYRDTIHPLMAFGVLFNLQNLLHVMKRIQYELEGINLTDLDDKTLANADKLSRKEHNKLNAIYLLVEHYISIVSFNDKFDSLVTIKIVINDSKWVALKLDQNVLKNQDMILNDLNYLRQNEVNIQEILNINKILIHELDSYLQMTKRTK
ncbi:MAG: hypothetical protein RLZ33_2194 [Bacteroidota bacterium]